MNYRIIDRLLGGNVIKRVYSINNMEF